MYYSGNTVIRYIRNEKKQNTNDKLLTIDGKFLKYIRQQQQNPRNYRRKTPFFILMGQMNLYLSFDWSTIQILVHLSNNSNEFSVFFSYCFRFVVQIIRPFHTFLHKTTTATEFNFSRGSCFHEIFSLFFFFVCVLCFV